MKKLIPLSLAALLATACAAHADEAAERGHALAQERCAKCHAIEGSGASPYPGVQPFRNLDARWTREHLAKALETGIWGENDQTGAIHEMRLAEAEIADLFAYLDTLKAPAE